jgi:tetratricopeptide (TPR) repeat protein
MRHFLLIALSLALCTYGWWQIRNCDSTPADAPKWNLFALRESGFGRTIARALTEQANTSYHHGLFEHTPPLSTNPFSHWLDVGSSSLGFQGRLQYRPVEQYPLRPYEVQQALEQAEKSLRLAFELDPGNYIAYDVYFFFLTNEVTQTEFASLAGTQLKDDDDEVSDEGGGTKGQQNGSQEPITTIDHLKKPAPPKSVFQKWAAQERQRRHARAIEITEEAIRKFRPDTMDPERFLTAAVMWYNRVMLLSPEPEERQKSAAAREKFEKIGPSALEKVTSYIQASRACQQDLEQKGLWKAIPERRAEYLRVMQLIDKCADSLSVALQHNRAQMVQDRPGSSIWGPLGQN